jgi:uncharacterized membrane protein
MTPSPAWSALLAAHLLAAIVWVGGMAYALLVLRPALAALEAQPRLQMHLLTLKRFFLIVWHAMPILLLSGWAMIGLAGGFAHVPWPVNAMQGLGLVMAALFVSVFFGPYRRLRRAIRPGPELLQRIRAIMTANLILGIATVILAVLADGWR